MATDRTTQPSPAEPDETAEVGPSPGRRDRKRADTRERLRTAGIELFASAGVAASTVRDIAERADVAERTFYRHFDSKEDLLLDDVRRYFTRATAWISARPLDEAPMTSLLLAAKAMTDEYRVPDAEVLWLSTAITEDAAARGHLHRLVDEYQEALSQVFAARRGLEVADYRAHLDAAVAGTAFVQAIGRFMVDDGASIEAYGVEAIRRYGAGCDPEAVAGVEALDA